MRIFVTMTMIDLDPNPTPKKSWAERNKWWALPVLLAVLEEIKFHYIIDHIVMWIK